MSALDLLSRKTLMGFWSEHKHDCRPVGEIVSDAREGKLPGVEEVESGLGFRVIDEKAALAAMRRA